MPKLNFRSKLRQIRTDRFQKLQDTRIVHKVRQKSVEREFEKNPIEYGEHDEMLTHPGLPMEKLNRAEDAREKKDAAAKSFRKARATERNSKVLEGVKIGKRATFESFSGNKYSGKVVGLNLEKGIISLQTGFLRISTKSYNISRLKSRIK